MALVALVHKLLADAGGDDDTADKAGVFQTSLNPMAIENLLNPNPATGSKPPGVWGRPY